MSTRNIFIDSLLGFQLKLSSFHMMSFDPNQKTLQRVLSFVITALMLGHFNSVLVTDCIPPEQLGYVQVFIVSPNSCLSSLKVLCLSMSLFPFHSN